MGAFGSAIVEDTNVLDSGGSGGGGDTDPCSDCITDTFDRETEPGFDISPPDIGPDYLQQRTVWLGVDQDPQIYVSGGALHLPFPTVSPGLSIATNQIGVAPGANCEGFTWSIEFEVAGLDQGGPGVFEGFDIFLADAFPAYAIRVGYSNYSGDLEGYVLEDGSGDNFGVFAAYDPGERIHVRASFAGTSLIARAWLPDRGQSIVNAVSYSRDYASIGSHEFEMQAVRTSHSGGVAAGTSMRLLMLAVTGC
jgi:hypothetical protein